MLSDKTCPQLARRQAEDPNVDRHCCWGTSQSRWKLKSMNEEFFRDIHTESCLRVLLCHSYIIHCCWNLFWQRNGCYNSQTHLLRAFGQRNIGSGHKFCSRYSALEPHFLTANLKAWLLGHIEWFISYVYTRLKSKLELKSSLREKVSCLSSVSFQGRISSCRRECPVTEEAVPEMLHPWWNLSERVTTTTCRRNGIAVIPTQPRPAH